MALLSSAFLVVSVSAAEYVKWTWSQELPVEISADSKRSKRTPEAVDKFFADGPSHPPSISMLLAFLGKPDGFSPQSMYSKTQGSKEACARGGTLRFLIDDGGELQVETYNFNGVILAIRHPKKGYSKLLYK
jgi:hypothetical protein